MPYGVLLKCNIRLPDFSNLGPIRYPSIGNATVNNLSESSFFFEGVTILC